MGCAEIQTKGRPSLGLDPLKPNVPFGRETGFAGESGPIPDKSREAWIDAMRNPWSAKRAFSAPSRDFQTATIPSLDSKRRSELFHPAPCLSIEDSTHGHHR